MLCLVEVVVVKLQGLTVISLVLPYRAKKVKALCQWFEYISCECSVKPMQFACL